MTEMHKGHWTRTLTRSGKDVLFWISDQEPREHVQKPDISPAGLVPPEDSDKEMSRRSLVNGSKQVISPPMSMH